MMEVSLLAAAGATKESLSASSPLISEDLGLLVLLVAILATGLNATRIIRILEQNDDADAHKLKRWPVALRSLSGGLAVAYVFLLLIPELAVISQQLSAWSVNAMVLALTGLLIFNGIQHFCLKRATTAHEAMGEWKFVGVRKAEKRSNFSINFGVFVAYAALILLTLPFQFSHLSGEALSRILFLVTFGLHLGFDALSVCEEDQHRFARLNLRLAVPIFLISAILAFTGVLSDLVLLAAFSLLAGIVMYKVFKVEVKSAAETSFVWFLAGSALFAVLNGLTLRAPH